MTKNNNIDTRHSNSDIKNILKYHYFFFIVIVLGGLVYCFVSINGILNIPTDTSFESSEKAKMIDKNFDTATIKKLDDLHYSQDSDEIVLPQGRINPFSE